MHDVLIDALLLVGVSAVILTLSALASRWHARRHWHHGVLHAHQPLARRGAPPHGSD